MKLRPVLVASLAALSALSMPAASAQAQLTASLPACASNLSLTLMNPDAVACSGAWNGNNIGTAASLAASLSQIQADFLSFVGAGTWSYVGTTNAASSTGPFGLVPGSITGTLSFDSPISGFFVIALKSNTNFSFYLFNGGAGISSVDFTTIGTSLNKRGIPQDLSHASLYDFDAVPTTTTPEPGTLVLMLSGLAGVVGVVRRRQA